LSYENLIFGFRYCLHKLKAKSIATKTEMQAAIESCAVVDPQYVLITERKPGIHPGNTLIVETYRRSGWAIIPPERLLEVGKMRST